MRKNSRFRGMGAVPLFSSLVLALAALIFVASPETVATQGLAGHAINILLAVAVFVQGCYVLTSVWRAEMYSLGGTMPFAWCFLAMQHMAFGFGGLVVALSDQGFSYANAQGTFSWTEVVAPFLLVHAVSLNCGWLGVRLAVGTRPVQRLSGSGFSQSHRGLSWFWRDCWGLCYVTLGMHAVIWLILLRLTLPEYVAYVVRAFSPIIHCAFVFWGIAWVDCDRKWVFLVYAAFFITLELILGARGDAFIPVILFGIGYLIANTGKKWNVSQFAKWLPVIVIVGWGSIRSEDLRQNFTRDSLNDLEDATARLSSLTSRSSQADTTDATGMPLNVAFRLGSRLFEGSVADVISRTPDPIPFWGWDENDTSDLMTSLLPLRSNSNAALQTTEDAGVRFLRSYGWTYVDPEGGNSMPASLVGDSWRRFGWLGVIPLFIGWCWMWAKASRYFRFSRDKVAMLIFSTGLTASYITQYDGDILSILSGVPRRLLVVALVTLAVWACWKLVAPPARHAAAPSPLPRRFLPAATWPKRFDP